MNEAEEESEEVSPWKARLLLICFGIFGVHRLYIRQVPEAFIMLSTFGVFLIGCFYDTFFFRNEVLHYNRGETEIREKYRKGRMQVSQSRIIPFSMNRFLSSVFYASWIGFLAWLACAVTFNLTNINQLAFIISQAFAISCGVWMVGQCGGQTREILYIWIASFSSSFILIRAFNVSVFRSIFLTSIIATLIGNRSAKYRSNKRSYSIKHFVFWTSLFCMLLCIIVLGCSRQIMDRKVTAMRPGLYHETSTIGSLIKDRLIEPSRVYAFFHSNPKINYHIVAPAVHIKEPPKRGEKSSLWDRIWSGDIFDEFMSSQHLTRVDWVEMATVFIVDVFRAESRIIHKDYLKEPVEPLKWAAWRNYLLHKFNLKPHASDDEIRVLCNNWNKRKSTSDGKDFGVLANDKACETILSF